MKLADLIATLETWYPPQTADDWDAVGLICGDPEQEINRVLLAIDPVAAVAEQAISNRAELVLVHHPLFLRGTSSVAANTPKGNLVHQLISNQVAMYAAHTNADIPTDGVSDAIAAAIGLTKQRPLLPAAAEYLDKLVFFAPPEAAEELKNAVFNAGAGAIGDYDSCAFTTTGDGQFRPLAAATPTIGKPGELTQLPEVKLEMVLPRARRQQVIAALLAAHPYEEPAYHLIELANPIDQDRGHGRIGEIAPISLAAFAANLVKIFPETVTGIRVAGNPEQVISKVALCGGAGDSFINTAKAAGADLYLTSDLRHHVVSEAVSDRFALVEVAHWAAEWMWLPLLAEKLRGHYQNDLEVLVSSLSTDPWTFRI